MKQLFTIIILGSTALVSADQYYGQPSCRSGNCQAGNRSQQENQQYQNQPRYNSQQQGNSSDRFVPRYYQQDGNQAGSQQDGQRYNQSVNDRNNGNNNRFDRNDRYNKNDNFNNNDNDNDNDDGDDNDGDNSASSDLAIFKNTQSALSSGMFSRAFDNVFFEVDDGYVTLRGTVDTAANKTKAEESVKAISGVKGVTNKITASDSIKAGAGQTGALQNYSGRTGMSQDSAATAEDKQLNDVIRNKLRQWLSTKNVDALVIKNQNGEIVLVGTVDKPEDVKKVDEQVKAINGVKRLDNRLMATTDNTRAGNSTNNAMPQDSALTPKDKELNSRIRDKLSSWLSSRNVEGMMIKTKNGEVVILGTVDKPEDIDKVNYQLKDIEGINRVDNQLKVKR